MKGAAMATQDQYRWRRDTDGLGVWEHRGKVAVAGYGHSPVDRRWDGTSMDQTLGAYSILACQKAMDEAGVTPDPIDGIICCQSHIAGGSGGMRAARAPARPAVRLLATPTGGPPRRAGGGVQASHPYG